MNFYTILTAIGKAKIANAQVTGTSVNLTKMAVGDGNGAYYEPTEAQTALINEVWRGNLNQITTDGSNPNWIIIEAVIPTTDGGFTVREAGIFDDAGDMIAVGKYPETYKPTLDEGSGKDLYIRMILEVSNASTVMLKIDPAVVLASRAYVDAHEGKTSTHGATAAATPNRIMMRAANGTAKVAAPVASDDIARKAEVDARETPGGAQAKVDTLKSDIEDGTVIAGNAATLNGKKFEVIEGIVTVSKGATEHVKVNAKFAIAFVNRASVTFEGGGAFVYPEWGLYNNQDAGAQSSYLKLSIKNTSADFDGDFPYEIIAWK